MKLKPIFIGLAVIGALVGLRFVIDLLQEPAAPTVVQKTESTAPESVVESGGGWQAAPVVAEKPEDDETAEQEGPTPEELIEQYGFDPEKIAALRAAKDGDPRTPPIERGPERVLPTPEELADPDLYLQYEERQHKQLLAGFVKAAGPKIELLKSIVEEGKTRQMSAEDIAVAEEKIKALEDMKAELLAKNPELADIETPLLDLSRFEKNPLQ